MGYKSKLEDEKILDEFPGLSAEDLAEVEYLRAIPVLRKDQLWPGDLDDLLP